MKKICNLIVFIIPFSLITGCGNHKRVKPHYKHKKRVAVDRSYYQQYKSRSQQSVPAAYSYPNRVRYVAHPREYVRYNQSSHARPKISRSLQELDRDSASVKPTMVYAQRAVGTNINAQMVNLNAMKYKMLNYINNIRARGNECGPPVGQIGWSNRLEDAANAHAGDMATNNFLGHLGSGRATDIAKKSLGRGSNFYERIMHFGYPVKGGSLAGEILTYTKYSIVGNRDPYLHFMHSIENFQKSARHCSILMNPRFRDLGIAAYRDNEKIYWVIEFGEATQ